MSLYRFSPHALDDLDALLYSLAERSGWDHSMDMEEKIYAALERIGRSPGIGHLREDLIPHEVYFDYAKPYLILYRRDTRPVYILAILHGARDIATIMQDRLP